MILFNIYHLYNDSLCFTYEDHLLENVDPVVSKLDEFSQK